MGDIIATVNMKGGVGKTTLAVNLAASLAKDHGKRVLVIDLDTQVNATLSLISINDFAKARKEKGTLKHLIAKVIQPNTNFAAKIQDLIVSNACDIQGLDVLSGDIDLYDEHMVSEILAREFVEQGGEDFDTVWNRFESKLVQELLQPVVNDYDFIILDCAPGYNLLTRSALISSKFYLMPARPEPLSLVGMQLLQRRIKQLQQSHKVENTVSPQLLGIVFSMTSSTLSKYYTQVMQRVVEDFGGDKICRTQIPVNVDVAIAVDNFKPVVLNAPKSTGAKAFTQLTQEILKRVDYFSKQSQKKKRLNLADLD